MAFGRGFYPLEVGNDGKTWTGTGEQGEAHLPNNGMNRIRRLRGWIPLEFMHGSPTIRIQLNGRDLDNSFAATERTLAKEYNVDRQDIGTGQSVLLLIQTSTPVFAPGDTRTLGVAIERIEWEPLE